MTHRLKDKEVQKATNKSGGGQTSKSTDKNPTHQYSNKASSGTRGGPVCYDRSILTKGCNGKYPKDHISVHCVQQAGWVLMSCFDMLLPYRCNSDRWVDSAGWRVARCALVSRHARNQSCPLRFVLVH